jgi:hypothetical protein
MEDKMTNTIESRDARRTVILEGLNSGLTNEKIAEKMGIHPRMVRRDLTRMKYSKDPELKQALKNAREKAIAAKEKKSNRAGDQFKRITGMTFQEKTFDNMMSFYGPEIRKILRAKEQDVAIRNLPSSVVRTLRRNGIVASGYRTPRLSKKARTHLTSACVNNS